MGKKGNFLSFILFVFVIFLFSGYLFSFGRAEELDSTPEWLKRINLSFEYETDKHPILYFETVQPFYQTEDKINTFFYQPRVSLSAGDLTYNFGVGYRRLFSDNLLWGINVFGDYEDLHEHARAGAGLEVLTQRLEARLNSYFGVTSKRVVEEGTSTIYEKVADGLDFELGAPLPYLPWLKLYGSGFWYDFDKTSDRMGWKSRLEAELSDALILEFYTWDDNKGEQEFGGKLECRLAFDSLSDLIENFKLADEPFPRKDLSQSTLIPVERNFDIVVEKWSETQNGNVDVVIGRAN
jgi:hypothetical protein